MVVEPKVFRRIAAPFEVAVDVELVNVLEEMFTSLSVPLKFKMSTPCQMDVSIAHIAIAKPAVRPAAAPTMSVSRGVHACC